MVHILKFVFKGTFISFDDVYMMAQNTSCIADLTTENCGLDSNVLIQLCDSSKYDLAGKTWADTIELMLTIHFWTTNFGKFYLAII